MTRGAVRENGEGDGKGETEDAPFCNHHYGKARGESRFPRMDSDTTTVASVAAAQCGETIQLSFTHHFLSSEGTSRMLRICS